MARLFRTLAALLVLALPSIALAAPQRINWGFETWQCGQNWFGIQIGKGVPVWITGVTGVISASALPGSYPGTVNRSSTDTTQVIALQRQALITLTSDAAVNSAIDGSVTTSPTSIGTRYTQSLDENYLAVDVKQDGYQVVHIPLNYTFPGGIELPTGQLKALVTATTYNGSTEVTDRPAECIDAETHLTIFYSYTQPIS